MGRGARGGGGGGAAYKESSQKASVFTKICICVRMREKIGSYPTPSWVTDFVPQFLWLFSKSTNNEHLANSRRLLSNRIPSLNQRRLPFGKYVSAVVRGTPCLTLFLRSFFFFFFFVYFIFPTSWQWCITRKWINPPSRCWKNYHLQIPSILAAIQSQVQHQSSRDWDIGQGARGIQLQGGRRRCSAPKAQRKKETQSGSLFLVPT